MELDQNRTISQIDHLVVAADSLSDGLYWCERTLGITPDPGGDHPLFGTHNRLIRLHADSHPYAYLEIIAIDPAVTPTREKNLARWFDLDKPSLRRQLQRDGPQLIHWVAQVPKVEAIATCWRDLGFDCGRIIEASRSSAKGLLQWKITVRDDGQRLLGGTLPTLIQWTSEHPSGAMKNHSLALRSLRLQHPRAHALTDALAMLGLTDIMVETGAPALFAELTLASGATICLSHYAPEP